MSTLDSFFHVRGRGESQTVAGQPRFFRGHAIPRGARALADGIFAGWEWDGRRLGVRNDRYGASPFFYWHDDQQFCVSPSILALIERGAPTAIDEAGLAAFLRLGFFLGDDTPFAAIRAVPPGSLLEWSNGTLRATGGRPRTKVNCATRDAAVDGFVTLFREAIARRPPDGRGTYVPLSSGRDSRHILFELCARGHRPQCVTIPRYPPRPGEDERVAPLVARAVGVPHSELRQNPSRFSTELQKNWATHLCADEHAWYLEMIATLGTTPTVVYDGLGGALSVANRFHSRDSLALVEAGKTRELADRLLTAYSVYTEAYLQRVLRPEAAVALSRAKAVERFATELDGHVDAPDPIKSFNFWNRIRRELALVPYGMMKHVATVYSPYLDHDLYDFLMGMPATAMAPQLASDDKSFHTEAIHRAFPQYRDLPFESKQAPRLDAGPHNARFAAEASRFILRHAHLQRRLVNRRFVLPRALYARGGTRFGQSRPWFASLCLYLTQLEMASERRLPSTIDIIEQRVQAA